MTTRSCLALASVLALCVYGCGGSDENSGQLSGQGSLPDDPSEQPGAPQDPDSPKNPNEGSTPTAPTTPGTTSDIAVTLSTATPVTDLGTSLDVTVTLTPKTSASGSAAMTVTGLPDGVTATFDPPSVSLNGTTAVTSKMTLAVAYTTIPSAPGAASAIVVHAGTSGGEATANANFKVNPQVTLYMPANTAALLKAGGGSMQIDAWGGPTFGKNAVPLHTQAGNGITFLVKNLDSVAHEIHGGNGFAHGSAAIPPGQFDSKQRVLDPAKGDINGIGYIHGEANGTSVGFKTMVYLAP